MSIDLYDHDRIALRKLGEVLRQDVGRNRDLEGWVQAVKHRGEELGFVLDVQMYEDDRDRSFHPVIDIVGRTIIEPHGFDFERQSWEVRKDIAGIEPDKVGITPPKFDPELLHADNPAKVIAKQMDVTESSLAHGHGPYGHTHTHDDGTTHSHEG